MPPKTVGTSVALRATVHLGIDPGASGGLAVCVHLPGLKPRVGVANMPATRTDIWQWVSGGWYESLEPVLNAKEYGDVTTALQQSSYSISAVVEKVTGVTHKRFDTGASMFKFGTSYGELCMALVAASIPFQEVMARVWQKAYNLTPVSKDPKVSNARARAMHKNNLKAKAQQLFPEARVTLKTCDALLIMEYGRRHLFTG